MFRQRPGCPFLRQEGQTESNRFTLPATMFPTLGKWLLAVMERLHKFAPRLSVGVGAGAGGVGLRPTNLVVPGTTNHLTNPPRHSPGFSFLMPVGGNANASQDVRRVLPARLSCAVCLIGAESRREICSKYER